MDPRIAKRRGSTSSEICKNCRSSEPSLAFQESIKGRGRRERDRDREKEREREKREKGQREAESRVALDRERERERAREREERERKTERLLSEHFNAFPPPEVNAISNEDETCVQETFSASVAVLTSKISQL
jgi:hypothetical protein